MEYEVIWTDAAIADLHEICAHMAHDNPQAAERMGYGLLKHVRLLASFPFIGPAYPRGTPGPLREIVFRPYRIFYDVREASRRVEILHVWHGAREEPVF